MRMSERFMFLRSAFESMFGSIFDFMRRQGVLEEVIQNYLSGNKS